jgi:hypothetical protein
MQATLARFAQRAKRGAFWWFISDSPSGLSVNFAAYSRWQESWISHMAYKTTSLQKSP